LTVVDTLLAFVVAEAILAQPDALQHPTSLSQTPDVELRKELEKIAHSELMNSPAAKEMPFPSHVRPLRVHSKHF
jgi:hypothetical protein